MSLVPRFLLPVAYLAYRQWSLQLAPSLFTALVSTISFTLGQGNQLLSPCGLPGLQTVDLQLAPSP